MPKPARVRESVEKRRVARRSSSPVKAPRPARELRRAAPVTPTSTQKSAVPARATPRRAPGPILVEGDAPLPAKRAAVASPLAASKTPKRVEAPPMGVGTTTPKRVEAPPMGVGTTTPKRVEASPLGVSTTPKRFAPPSVKIASEEATAKRAVGADRAQPGAKSDEQVSSTPGRLMELHWGDSPPPPSSRAHSLVQRWMKRGDALLRHLAEHGVARHEFRADLREGRFVWLSPEGRVSAEAKAQVICCYATTTSVIAMGWADPLSRSVAIPRVEGMPPERDNIDEEAAWRVAMHAADVTRAEYLYRVTTPHAWYFLALRQLTFTPARASFNPGTPVGLVLRSLIQTRQAIESRAEPTEVVRARLAGVGQALLQEASYAYRGTDWVARLERTGKCLLHLAERLPRASFHSVAAGRYVEEWLDREATVDLSQALMLFEDEWSLFT